MGQKVQTPKPLLPPRTLLHLHKVTVIDDASAFTSGYFGVTFSCWCCRSSRLVSMVTGNLRDHLPHPHQWHNRSKSLKRDAFYWDGRVHLTAARKHVFIDCISKYNAFIFLKPRLLLVLWLTQLKWKINNDLMVSVWINNIIVVQ